MTRSSRRPPWALPASPGPTRHKVAPLVGASKTSHVDDAIASLDIELTADEIAQLEAPYTPRYDFQGISDDAELTRIMARLPGFAHAGN